MVPKSIVGAMNKVSGQQSSHNLLALAQEQGYKVSQTQLARWHRAGLLPKPAQFAQGKGRGTRSLYPEGTGVQFLLLCELHVHERRLSHLGWQLWWAGYPVSPHIIRAHLSTAATHLSSRVHYFSDLKNDEHDTEVTTSYLSDHMLDIIEHITEDRLHAKFLRRARKRIGRGPFSTFVRILIDIASGNFTGVTQQEQETFTELRILAQGLGFEKLFINKGANVEYYVGNLFIPFLQHLSAWFITYPWEQTLATTTDFDLMRVRDELHTYLLGIQHMTQAYLPRDYPHWDTAFLATFSQLAVEEQALLLLIWLSLEKSTLFDTSFL
jgi:hypothetical protein